MMFSIDQITMRQMTGVDIPKVKTVVNQIWNGDDFYESYYPIVNHIPVVMAEYQENLIGIAAVYHNTLHPNWPYIMVAVAEAFRRQGLGRKLHAAALQAWPLKDYHHGTQGCYYLGDEVAAAFLRSLGYQLQLDCHCVDLNLENFDFTSYLELPSHGESGSFAIASFADLFLQSGKQQDVFDFLVSRYTEEHFWSPPQSKDYPGWWEIVFDHILPELSFALLAEGQVVGAVTAGVVDENTLDMIWGYVSRRYSVSEAVSLLQFLLAHQFQAARDRGLSRSEAEIDTTDAVYSSLLTWLPICNNQVWRILQKPLFP
jgi:GNAT superfamily N-acetyltransferase